MDREEGLSVVCALVADSLGLATEAVTPQSRLVTDLSADSLDIIDLVFTLERRFALKLRNGELDALLRGELFTPEAVVDGFLRPEAVDRLGRVIPALASVADQGRVTPGQIVSLITVDSLWLMVEQRMPKP